MGFSGETGLSKQISIFVEPRRDRGFTRSSFGLMGPDSTSKLRASRAGRPSFRVDQVD
jgi:hypothetical protein